MPLRRVAYRSLTALLDRELDLGEDPDTVALMRRVEVARRRGGPGRGLFVAMCRWKSPRPTRLYLGNSAAVIRRALRAALAARSERRRIEVLLALSGVSVAVASAVLTLLHPRRYGVLDIRVWQLLHALGAVAWRPSGRGFTVDDYLHFLHALRSEAGRLGAPVRAVELSLFKAHRRLQRGRLYDPPPPAAPERPRPTASRPGARRRPG